MRFMSREFKNSEKLLLAFLAMILIGLFYYRFIDIPVRDAITSAEADNALIQSEMDMLEIRIMQLRGIRDNLTEMEESGELTYMPSYNSSKAEVAFLNEILADTIVYTITFADVSRIGNQIRRNFTLQFQTRNYDEARRVMARLSNGKYRCLVGDIRCSMDKDKAVTINTTATFYETMVGGTPDAALPLDAAEVK